MKRLFMTADAVGGVWEYALDLAAGLGRRGTAVTLAVMGPSPSSVQRLAAEAVPGLRLIDTGLPLDWTAPSPEALAAAAARLAELAAAEEADFVHLHTAALAAFPFPVPVVAVQHSCVATWWQAVRGGSLADLPPDLRWRADLVSAGMRRAAALVAPTAALAKATARVHGLKRPPRVVHNGRARSPVADALALADVLPDAPVPFAFTAGRLWDEGKDIATLDRAASLAPVRVIAAGSLRGPGGGAAQFRHLDCLGRLDDAVVAGWLAQRPIYVSTALYEPFGLAVLEAAQAGCALVLAAIPSFRELWDGCALFVPPRDAAAVAEAIAFLASPAGRQRRRDLGHAARRRAQRYSVEAMVAGIAGIYDSLLSAQPVLEAAQ